MTNILKALFVLIVLALLLDSCCSYKEKRVIVRDTVLTDVSVDTIFFDNTPELVYDSTLPDIIIKPFEFKVDTIIPRFSNGKWESDTIKIHYDFLENLLNFSYKAPPDSTFKEIITDTITHVEELGFWDYLPIVVSTALIFFVLGYIVSKFR